MPDLKLILGAAKFTALVTAVQSLLELADLWDKEKADIALIIAARYLRKDAITKTEAAKILSKWMDNGISDPHYID